MKNRILIVDDSFYMRTMLKNMLTDAGYDVVGEAANGQQALEMAAATRPDLITLDVILPDNTGLDVLKGIRQEQPDVRIVMCSAVGQEVIVNEALESGAVAYIVKPFSEEKVLEIVGSMLQQGNDKSDTSAEPSATPEAGTADTDADTSSESTPQA
ncbi:response regulator [Hymenobacter sp. BT730]|uniref:response regulator n=1 Tax=Hymenobacter sp. BT730 TaxID=3063332 RepID=UPI0026DF00B2|nr:response regulator [Hymenobacter sp. BT730]